MTTEYALKQNVPNPFNANTSFRYELPDRCRVVIEVYNKLGETVATLVDGVEEAGRHSVAWNAAGGAGPGVYFCRMTASSIVDPERTFVQIRKVLLAS